VIDVVRAAAGGVALVPVDQGAALPGRGNHLVRPLRDRVISEAGGAAFAVYCGQRLELQPRLPGRRGGVGVGDLLPGPGGPGGGGGHVLECVVRVVGRGGEVSEGVGIGEYIIVVVVGLLGRVPERVGDLGYLPGRVEREHGRPAVAVGQVRGGGIHGREGVHGLRPGVSGVNDFRGLPVAAVGQVRPGATGIGEGDQTPVGEREEGFLPVRVDERFHPPVAVIVDPNAPAQGLIGDLRG